MNLDGGNPSCQMQLKNLKYSIIGSRFLCSWFCFPNRLKIVIVIAYELVLGRDNSKFILVEVTAKLIS